MLRQVAQSQLQDFRPKSQTRSEQILSTKRLDASTLVKAGAERLCKRTLLNEGVIALYEPFTLSFNRTFTCKSGTSTYGPDFFLPFNKIDQRPIAIEPHSGDLLTLEYLDRLKHIKEEYGFYIVVLSNDSEFFRLREVEARIIRVYGNEFVDELWFSSTNDPYIFNYRIRRLLRASTFIVDEAIEKAVGKSGRNSFLRKQPVSSLSA
jgi:hypothetical protein